MADIPTISYLQSQVENDIRTKLEITATWYGKVMLRVLALVQAAKLKLIYLLIASVQKNIFVDTADSESNGGTLERFGRVKLGRNPYPAHAGVYTINVTGILGGIITKGIAFKSSLGSTSPNYLYEVVSSVTLTGTTGQVQIRALTAGATSVLQAGDQVEATAPIANVNSTATIASVYTTPVDAETIETYRKLVIESFQLEPQGGAATDYRIWAADAAGVRTVYPYTKNNAINVVQLFVEALPEDSEPGQPDGVPTQAIIDDVIDVIELDPDTTKVLNERGRRPVQVVLECISVIPIGVTITIYDLSDKSTTILNAIQTDLISLFYDIRPYIAGADGETKNDTLYLSQVVAAIFNAIGSGVNFSNIEIKINSTVYSFYQFGNVPGTYGNYPYLENLITP
jgi:uncharacterized phage protein gp47/JayE